MNRGRFRYGYRVKVKPIAPNRSYKDVSSSRLNIQLLGTVVAEGKSATVVMAQGLNEQKVLFLGDSIQLRVILEKVMQKKLYLIERDNWNKLHSRKMAIKQSLLQIVQKCTIIGLIDFESEFKSGGKKYYLSDELAIVSDLFNTKETNILLL